MERVAEAVMSFLCAVNVALDAGIDDEQRRHAIRVLESWRDNLHLSSNTKADLHATLRRLNGGPTPDMIH
jgi:hypothetical protein